MDMSNKIKWEHCPLVKARRGCYNGTNDHAERG